MMLPGQDQLPLHPPYERVLLAIVGLADGRLERVAEFSAAATADWRDVLSWWETPELADVASLDIEATRPEEHDE